jgi:hypothetical protein
MNKSTTLLLTLILIAATLNCGGESDDSSSDFYTGSGGGSSGTTSTTPDPNYIGSWKGTWSYGSANHGTLTLSVSASGSLSGEMEYVGTTLQGVNGTGVLTGHLGGTSAHFSFKFPHNSVTLSCTGTFGNISGGESKLSFDIDDSKASGYFILSKQ